MRILCDLDSTVVNLLDTWLAEHNAAQEDDLTIEKLLKWDMHIYAKGGNRIYDVLKRPGMFRNLEPLPGAVEAVEAMVNSGHDVFMVSAGSFHLNFSEKFEWCREHLPFIKKRRIIFAHEKHLINSDVFIDDSPANVKAYRMHHPDAKILGIEFPYNKGCSSYTLLAPDYKDTKAAWDLILKEI